MSAPVSLHPRAADEFYVEPQWATELLLDHEDFACAVWDPACGSGNVCKALIASGYTALGTDIVRRAEGSDPWWRGERDFLASPLLGGADIVTNPPFFRSAGTEAFIRHALKIGAEKVAIFADVKFLASQRRANGLFADHCPSRVWIHAKRPSCPPGTHLAAGNEAKGGTADWCWLVWDNRIPRAGQITTAELGWLR